MERYMATMHTRNDYRNDEILLHHMEIEVSLARRFFEIVDFINANYKEEMAEDRKLLSQLGNNHWQKAREFLRERRLQVREYGEMPYDQQVLSRKYR